MTPLSANSQLILDWQRMAVDATFVVDKETLLRQEKEAKLAEICEAMNSLKLHSNS